MNRSPIHVPLATLLGLALASCGGGETSYGGQPPPLRLLSEADVTAWSAASLTLAQRGQTDSLAGQFASLEEMIVHLEANPKGVEAACAEQEISPEDYVEICRAIQVSRSIEFGIWLEAQDRIRDSTPQPTPPAPTHDAIRDLPEPPVPPAPEPPEEPAASVEESLPETPRANLELYRVHATEIERLINLFAFQAEGGVR